jgi:hypothetical protein
VPIAAEFERVFIHRLTVQRHFVSSFGLNALISDVELNRFAWTESLGVGWLSGWCRGLFLTTFQVVRACQVVLNLQQFPAHGTAWTQTRRRGNLGKPTENEVESLSHRFCDIRSPAVGRRRCLRRPIRRNPIFTAYLRRPGIAVESPGCPRSHDHPRWPGCTHWPGCPRCDALLKTGSRFHGVQRVRIVESWLPCCMLKGTLTGVVSWLCLP